MAELEQLVDLDAADEEAQLVAAKPARRGFLPIQTNWFDRLFISIYIVRRARAPLDALPRAGRSAALDLPHHRRSPLAS